jgi:hypothetical protein
MYHSYDSLDRARAGLPTSETRSLREYEHAIDDAIPRIEAAQTIEALYAAVGSVIELAHKESTTSETMKSELEAYIATPISNAVEEVQGHQETAEKFNAAIRDRLATFS